MASLAGQLVRESYKGLLKTKDNTPISGSSSFTITDGEGNSTPLVLSTGSVQITGSQSTGSTTIKGGFTIIDGAGLLIRPFPGTPIDPLPPGNPQNPNLTISGSLTVTGSVTFTGLTVCTSSYVLVYNPTTGRVCYTSSCCTTASQDEHPIDITGSTYYSRGTGASTSNFSQVHGIFIGQNTGYLATAADYSIFLGYNTGYDSSQATYSNFIGFNTGRQAINAFNSNFLGFQAGYQATNANNSNFIGEYAGYQASSASYSTLIGYKVGKAFTNKTEIGSNNIIIGTNISLPAGRQDSINLGGIIFGTGSYNVADNSGDAFTGSAAGKIGINEPLPTHNFQVSGTVAFPNLTTATQNNVVTIDTATGRLYYTASSAFGGGGVADEHPIDISGSSYYSRAAGASTSGFSQIYGVFIGQNAGKNASYALNSIHLGQEAGSNAYSASYSNFFGTFAGADAFNAPYSNFIGTEAGYSSSNAFTSNFIGRKAGYESPNAYNSNFIGDRAGYRATNAQFSNFLGNGAGYQATDVISSNFIGSNSGIGASNAIYSNFMGESSGRYAINAQFSNFIGWLAGDFATNANKSNFMGFAAGAYASEAQLSNFIGTYAGYQASLANTSNFFGYEAGYQSSGNNVNAFGYQAAKSNTLSGMTVFSNSSLPSYANRAAATAAITVLNGASPNCTYLYYNEATFAIEGVRL